MFHRLFVNFAIYITLCGYALASEAAVRCVQSELTTLGFSPGTSDGKIGAKTLSSLEELRTRISDSFKGVDLDKLVPIELVLKLSDETSDMWCNQIPAHYPETRGSLVAYNTALSSSVIQVADASVAKNAAGLQVMDVSYFVDGDSPVTVDGICTFTGKGMSCFDAQSNEGMPCLKPDACGDSSANEYGRSVISIMLLGDDMPPAFQVALHYRSGTKSGYSQWIFGHVVAE